MKNGFMNFRLLIVWILIQLSFTPSFSQEIGLELYSLRNQFAKDIPGTLKLVKDMGIKQIELAGTYGMSKTDFVKLTKQNNLTIIGTGAEFSQLEGDMQRVVTEAKEVGARYVVCFWIPHKGHDFSIEEIKKAVTVFNNAGKILQQNGISFCYHPHGYEFRPYEGGTLFDYMINNTDSRYVNFEMDVFWVKHPGQDPVALLNKYPKRFALMHLKDRKPGTEGNQNGEADVETNVVLGTGDVGIAAIMSAAKKAGVKHYFIEDESSRSVEQIPASIKFLKSIK